MSPSGSVALTLPLTTPVNAFGTPTTGVLTTGARLAGVKGATITATGLVEESPRLPISPKESRLSNPARPWIAKPLGASLTVTRKESVTPAATAASGV